MDFTETYDSFYEYLIDKGYLFDYSIIETFLLSIKSNPFVIFIGNSGCGKSVLPKLFAEYLSACDKKEDIILHSTNSLGKSYSNKEWHLKRDVISKILPVLPFEGKDCSFTINDSFTSFGYFKIDPRFKFRDKKLINYLLELQKENPNQDLELKIKVGEKRTDANYFKINDYKNIELLFEDLALNEENSYIFKFLNRAKLKSNVNYFLIVDNIDKKSEKTFLKLLDYINEKFLVKYKLNNLFVIGNINVTEFYNPSEVLIDRVNFIELYDCNIEKYLSVKFNEFSEFKDLNYLEFNNEDVLNLSIIELKSIFQEIWCNGSDLWHLISNELILIDKIFSKEDITINFRTINDILRFMLVSWKYEGKQYNWENWQKYFDIQFKQKLLSKIVKVPSSSKFFKELLELCINSVNEGVNERNIKYKKSYLKIRNIEENLDAMNFSFFRCNNVKEISLDNKKDNVSKNSSDKNTSKYGSNIYKLGDYFIINKQINRKHINFGKFETLEDAKFVKEILVENDWKLSRIRNNDCIYKNNDLYFVIKVLNNKLNILGKFYSYNEANEHVDWLISKFKNDESFKVYVSRKHEQKLLNSSEFDNVIANISGWEKLVFDAINDIESIVFSLNDLKNLERFEMYQFEDESLEQIIKENLNKLANLRLIRIMGSNYYKKVF